MRDEGVGLDWMKCLLLTSTGDDFEHLRIIPTFDSTLCRFCQGCFLGLFFPFVTGSLHQHDVSETGSLRSVVLILLKQRLIGSLLTPSFCIPKSVICQVPSNFTIQTLFQPLQHPRKPNSVTTKEALRFFETS
jgi:hypothetical protein